MVRGCSASSGLPSGPTSCDNSYTKQYGQYQTSPPGGGGGGLGCEDEVCPDACMGSVNYTLYPSTGCPSYWESNGCWCYQPSPILIDVLGNGFDLTDASDGVLFDIGADGQIDQVAWTALASDDAWLVLDRNGNDIIDDAKELFGTVTPQPTSAHANGFLALAVYDEPDNGGNEDSVIDRGDAIFSQLWLWQDTNHNGISEENELHTLSSLGIESMDLNYRESRRQDQYGNLFRYRAKVYGANHVHLGRWAYDVFLVSQ